MAAIVILNLSNLDMKKNYIEVITNCKDEIRALQSGITIPENSQVFHFEDNREAVDYVNIFPNHNSGLKKLYTPLNE